MAAAPLTHHEILARAAPFVRSGRLVDMAASDRAARRLLFKPHALDELNPPLVETLLMDEPEPDELRLARALADPQGLRASLHAEGEDAAELLARVLAIAPETQFDRGPGWAIAWSLRLRGAPGTSAAARLTLAELRVDGLTLKVKVSSVDRIAAEIDITAAADDFAGDIVELPQDLLAVLGRDFSPLDRTGSGWRARMDIRGRGPERTAQAKAQLVAAAQHLARTLAEPPRRFHDRQRAARWRVTARRAVPLAVCFGVVLAALAVPALNLSEDSVWRMLIFNAPPILLGLFFMLREIPRVEFPPLPRPSAASTWRRNGAPHTETAGR